MAKAKSPRIPQYRRHKAKNLAAVTIDGRHIYLGPYDSPESHQRYRQAVAKWLAGLNLPPLEPSDESDPSYLGINSVVERFLAHCESYYHKDGKPASEVACISSPRSRQLLQFRPQCLTPK